MLQSRSCSVGGAAPLARARRPRRRLSAGLARASLDDERARAYRTLGVAEGASDEAVKRAWKRLALRCHPDHAGDSQQFVAAKAAYELLRAGGGEKERPGWALRWRAQLNKLGKRWTRARNDDDTNNSGGEDAPAPEEAQPRKRGTGEAAPDGSDEVSLRTRQQLYNLKMRAQRRRGRG